MKKYIVIIASIINIVMLGGCAYDYYHMPIRIQTITKTNTIYKNVTPDDASNFGNAILTGSITDPGHTLREACPKGVRMIDTDGMGKDKSILDCK